MDPALRSALLALPTGTPAAHNALFPYFAQWALDAYTEEIRAYRCLARLLGHLLGRLPAGPPSALCWKLGHTSSCGRRPALLLAAHLPLPSTLSPPRPAPPCPALPCPQGGGPDGRPAAAAPVVPHGARPGPTSHLPRRPNELGQDVQCATGHARRAVGYADRAVAGAPCARGCQQELPGSTAGIKPSAAAVPSSPAYAGAATQRHRQQTCRALRPRHNSAAAERSTRLAWSCWYCRRVLRPAAPAGHGGLRLVQRRRNLLQPRHRRVPFAGTVYTCLA
jgi:hypothetical protein